MIKIENLTKLYKKNKTVTCRALDSVSTVLPDKGLVFILGKSGSGKSTLLNLIGGLDSFDGGDIVSFGNSLAAFTEEDYEAYRSDFVSFVFQDYHLIDELTVLENITLFGDDEVDTELLRGTLEKVGMTDYVQRYPGELSGGQKQRVAIARGIMKNPHVILCDEPTGNLDKQTSYQILELLKKLSEEKLVVVVSHNLTEAETFADRIIELADGRIISDRVRDAAYRDGFFIEDGRATLPYRGRMSDEELGQLNSAISDGTVSEIALASSGFNPTDLEYIEEKRELKLRVLGKENVRRLFKKFFFSKYKIAISTIILSLLMFGLFSIIQAFIGFDPNRALIEALDEERSLIAIERDSSTKILSIYDEPSELSAEKRYKLYPQTIWIDNEHGSSWDLGTRIPDNLNLETLYIHENYGLLMCDEEYLSYLFGRDGEIRLLAGSIDGARETGVLITDYFADSVLRHEREKIGSTYTTYDSLIGIFNPCGTNNACRIAGIIDTDYEQKYAGLFAEYDELVSQGADGKKRLENFIAKDPEYIKFADEVMMNLGVAYSLNPNYIDDFTLAETSLVKTTGLYLISANAVVSGKDLNYMSLNTTGISTSDLADGEIAIPYGMYNELFGTEYTSEDANLLHHIEPQIVAVRRYVDDNPTRDVLYEMIFTVTAVTESRIVANENTMLSFKRADWHPSRIYVRDISDVDIAVELTEKAAYRFVARSQRNVQRINELISTFYDLFLFLEITAIVMLAFFLILFGIRSIKQNSYQIGVIKALGGRNRDVEKIFVIKTFIIGILISVVSIATSVFFIRFADKVLIASIETVLGMKVGGLHVIRFIPRLIALDGVLMILMALVSSVIPVILLKRIKPVEIIKAKE